MHRFADIGIIIGDDAYWGRGFASEAIKLVISYAFDRLKLHKLTAGCYATNAGATKDKDPYELGARLSLSF